MLTKTITIQMAEGFHMRPASQMVKILKPFQSEITMIYGEKRINAKQLMKIWAPALKRERKSPLNARVRMKPPQWRGSRNWSKTTSGNESGMREEKRIPPAAAAIL